MKRRFLEECLAQGMSLKAIGREAGKHPSTVGYWMQKYGLKTLGSQRRDALARMRETGRREAWLNCRRHGPTKFMAVGSVPRLRCAKCRSEAVSRRRRKVKEILAAEAGGSCVVCGYARHVVALHFHHVDPSTKSFGLGVRGVTRSIARLRREAAKCVLLCANCHAEVEAGLAEVPIKSRESIAIRGGSSD